jgi:hypothetical protein
MDREREREREGRDRERERERTSEMHHAGTPYAVLMRSRQSRR